MGEIALLCLITHEVAGESCPLLAKWPEETLGPLCGREHFFGTCALNCPGMSGDSSSWKGWGHVRWFIEEAGAA